MQCEQDEVVVVVSVGVLRAPCNGEGECTPHGLMPERLGSLSSTGPAIVELDAPLDEHESPDGVGLESSTSERYGVSPSRIHRGLKMLSVLRLERRSGSLQQRR